ncbi:hypothetical protein [uncultured Cohaesibacter sp.]|uniref:spermine/spermidine synthase domain-containing protein n=1 Tax=uncultured Cohaesibacter sp. TaxID=1002546 RepID=UPI002AA88BC3|nr:hypothetical protein [uncultured Cohaesibacter sp.]
MDQFREKISGSVWLSELDVIQTKSNEKQNIIYLRSPDYGRVLVIDDELQHVEAWAPLYHEMITHLPCSFFSEIGNVLILGGGSLFAAQELLKYDSLQSIDLVDHDMDVISATLEVYPERQGVAEDVRLNIIEDRFQDFLDYSSEKYDLIINDCCDLYKVDKESKTDYYKKLESFLSERGIVSDLLYRSIYTDTHSKQALARVPKELNRAASLFAVPEYPGCMHILSMWGHNNELNQSHVRSINNKQYAMEKSGAFEIFSPEFLRYYLYLPPYFSKYTK